MANHLQTNIIQHLRYQANYSNKTMEILNENTARSINQTEQHELQIHQLISDVSQLRNLYQTSQQTIEKLEKKLLDLETADNKSNRKSTNKKNQATAQDVDSNEHLKRDKALKELTARVDKHTTSINELDLRFQLHENTTDDGCLLWKIDRYKYRKEQALLGKITALHSAPTFTWKHGYKFCARLYPYGDGMGKGTHLSLFIVIMKSEYDNLLEWPFTKQVQFSLINQTDRQNDIVEKLTGNKDSSSFKKPVKDMNIASGCPLFASLDRLEKDGFVKDDSLFIEIKVL